MAMGLLARHERMGGASLPVHVRDDRLSLLLDLGSMLHREVGLDALLAEIGSRIARALEAERATIFVVDAATGELRSKIATLPEIREIRLSPGQGIAGTVAQTGRPINVSDTAADPRWYPAVDQKTGFKTRSVLAVPIVDGRRATRGVVQVINKRDGSFTEQDEAFLSTLAAQIALAFEWTTLRPDGAPRGVWVRGPYNHIVGASPAMQAVYHKLERAAATSATVLLLGETGTGKGLLARAIHANSQRAQGPFVTVDCTTLPNTLVESELFGHERGAFTGADRKVTGKVDGADGGTLFLDEIGELSPLSQAKLLRLLQERKFERVGGRDTIEVDVRLVVATHRDLAAEVTRGAFRQDLFYRLRVVEIELPPLRQRGRDEIIALARHFLGLYARRHGREQLYFDDAAIAALGRHHWPGNVRELEHSVERAVVLTDGPALTPDLLGLKPEALPPPTAPGVNLPFGLPLADVERRYLEATIEACDGNISEAARRLGIGRNTIARKLGRKA